MEDKKRVFNFSKEVTYIEHQEVTVQSGAVFYNGPKQEEQKVCKVTDVLESEHARMLLGNARQRGWLDDNLQPLVSQNKAAILASVIADELEIQPRWAPFEQLWGIDDMANKLSHAQMCKYYAETLKEFEELLA